MSTIRNSNPTTYETPTLAGQFFAVAQFFAGSAMLLVGGALTLTLFMMPVGLPMALLGGFMLASLMSNKPHNRR